jgi:hypothetical protein
MVLQGSKFLSFRPQTKRWTLHLPSPATHSREGQSSIISVGAFNLPLKVFISNAPPAEDTLFTPIKTKTMDRTKLGKIGPVIGILTVKEGSNFKGRKQNFRDIIQTAKRFGSLVYVFTVEDILWETHQTKAYFLHEKGKRWIAVNHFPLPDVIYNRIPYREDERLDHVRHTLQRLQAIPSLKLFNPQFFNKRRLYHILKNNSKTAAYLPETKSLTNFEDFNEMLIKYPLLYLKPVNGKAGKGIMTIQTSGDAYVLKFLDGEHLSTHLHRHPSSLWKVLQPYIDEDYMIQQGIDLLTYDLRPFDIRALVQKDRTGTWKISGVGIRVAGKNSITTHVPRGGQIASPKEVLKPLFTEEQYPLFINKLKTTLLELAHALDPHQLLGEMSMDIGLDEQRRLWFFEANAKPMKFDEPHIRKKSLEQIIHYAHYLADF